VGTCPPLSHWAVMKNDLLMVDTLVSLSQLAGQQVGCLGKCVYQKHVMAGKGPGALRGGG
jgi:hypothetical protein